MLKVILDGDLVLIHTYLAHNLLLLIGIILVSVSAYTVLQVAQWLVSTDTVSSVRRLVIAW